MSRKAFAKDRRVLLLLARGGAFAHPRSVGRRRGEYWLDPRIELARSYRLSAQDLRRGRAVDRGARAGDSRCLEPSLRKLRSRTSRSTGSGCSWTAASCSCPSRISLGSSEPRSGDPSARAAAAWAPL